MPSRGVILLPDEQGNDVLYVITPDENYRACFGYELLVRIMADTRIMIASNDSERAIRYAEKVMIPFLDRVKELGSMAEWFHVMLLLLDSGCVFEADFRNPDRHNIPVPFGPYSVITTPEEIRRVAAERVRTAQEDKRVALRQVNSILKGEL